MLTRLRSIFQAIALSIFIFQALKSFNRYLSFPVVLQNSEAIIDTIQKPTFLACSKVRFDYVKGNEEGYLQHLMFLAGFLSNSSRPTWRGKYGNSSFFSIADTLFENDFSGVSVNIDTAPKKIFLFSQGYCLEILPGSFNKFLQITSRDIPLKIFSIHETTNTKVTNDKSDNFGITLDVGSPNSSQNHVLTYEVSYEVNDNMLFEGSTCVDYRKQKENYGDCLLKAFKYHISTIYTCYPPWIVGLEGKECEKDIETLEIENGRYEKIVLELDFLTDGNHIDVMDECRKPCYTIKVNLIEKVHIQNYKDPSYARIIDNAKTVTIYKSTYSFDIFALVVELGSALGLWLGMSAISFLDYGIIFWPKLRKIICDLTTYP